MDWLKDDKQDIDEVLVEDAITTAQSLTAEFGPFVWNIIQAIAFLIGGWMVAGFVRGFIRRRVLASPKLDDTLGTFFASIAYYLILAVIATLVLQLFGFEATSLVAVLGAATLAIGLALQGTLSHVAAGVMIIFFRPYKLDDFVQMAGEMGTVNEINIFFTKLATIHNVEVIIANGDAWGSTITNYSTNATRRLDITFGIDYSDDINKAMEIILDEVEKDGRGLKDPAEPWVRVVELNESCVDLQLRVWCEGADLWEMKFALLKNVKEAFDAGGISIPYPHQVEIQKVDA